MMFSKSLSLGKWFGIEIHLDLSWFIIFFLVTWSLAMGVFPDSYPAFGLKLNFILGIITSILFFLSALAHELSHSLVARAQGLSVKRITLFLFGGAAQLTDEPSSPAVEFKMAVVGPLSSLFLALFFWSLKVWSRELGLGTPSIAVFSTLASINLVLALFNLLPGFPLDGGRILRAGLWKLTKNLKLATTWAARGGRLVAWFIIFTGASRFFAADLADGIWLLFLGLFLDRAVQMSKKESLLRSALADVLVKDVMRPDPPAVPSTISIHELINEYLLPGRRRCLVVVDEKGSPVGLIGIDSLGETPKLDPNTAKVKDLMHPLERSEALRPNEDVMAAIQRLAASPLHALAVMQNSELVGLLSEEDLGVYLALVSLEKANHDR
jgi:Zn-dependent protease